jgi:exodeoxyribonuclease V alpha subunit
MTVHRLLHLYPDTIDAHFVLIDEASMLSAELLHKLIQIVGRSTQIAFFGDPDQLPPVDAPSLFREIAHTFGVKLETGLRAESTALIELAAAVREGNEKRAIELLDGSDKTVRRLSAAQILERIPLPTYERPPHPSEAWRLFSSYRVLLPLRRGAEGLDALHRNLFSTYAQRLTPGMWWSAPILIAKNAPAIDLFNGSPGLLIGLFDGTFLFEQAKAYFPDEGGGEMREIPLALLPPYEWGFCLSVHKSQGSEFAEVGAIFPSGSEAFGREGLYTAVTRAKKGVGIAIEDETLKALLKKRAQTGSGWSERVNSAGKVAD